MLPPSPSPSVTQDMLEMQESQAAGAAAGGAGPGGVAVVGGAPSVREIRPEDVYGLIAILKLMQKVCLRFGSCGVCLWVRWLVSVPALGLELPFGLFSLGRVSRCVGPAGGTRNSPDHVYVCSPPPLFFSNISTNRC